MPRLSWNEMQTCSTLCPVKVTPPRPTPDMKSGATYWLACSLADLYDPLTMPPELTKAHQPLDRAVGRLYSKKPFESDKERLELLFKRYGELTS